MKPMHARLTSRAPWLLQLGCATAAIAALVSLAGNSAMITPAVAASALNGTWCNEAGKRLRIDGRTLIEPDGTRQQGRAQGDVFTYRKRVPGGADRQVDLNRVGPDALVMTQRNLSARGSGVLSRPPQVWKRCEAPAARRPGRDAPDQAATAALFVDQAAGASEFAPRSLLGSTWVNPSVRPSSSAPPM